jgi:hypothetical protein
MSQEEQNGPNSELILYRTEDAQTRIQVRLEGESVWLTQRQLADLFQVSVPTINEHLAGIYGEGELDPERTIRKFRIVQMEGERQVKRIADHYHLDAIIAVGYRVRSARGTQFRQWATERLSSYLVKGFALDDVRLKRGPDDGYFEELLDKIRDIRSSEKMFWRQVLKIYGTSIDYDASAEASQRFFATVQNKMHWAAHGHTAAELIVKRADGGKPNGGMTNWVGATPRSTDASVAKSYLQADELEALNRIVTAYLEFAELQALNRRAIPGQSLPSSSIPRPLLMRTRAALSNRQRDGSSSAIRPTSVIPAIAGSQGRCLQPIDSTRALDTRNRITCLRPSSPPPSAPVP